MMELFVKIVNSFQPLAIFAKSSIKYVWQGSKLKDKVEKLRSKIQVRKEWS